MSFRGIGAKIKTGYEDNESNETEKKKEPVFNSTKAFKLFSQGKAPIEVAIKLDLEYEENIFLIMKKHGLNSKQQIVNAIKYADELP